MDTTAMTNEQLTHIVTLREKYPQFNSPTDWHELKLCKAELAARNQPQPERQDATDFKYRLERYGY